MYLVLGEAGFHTLWVCTASKSRSGRRKQHLCDLASGATLVVARAGTVETMLVDEEVLEMAEASRALHGEELNIWETSEKV